MEKLLVICGPTATGKTSLGIHLAKVLNGEIVSADSRQVYKGMDIGTGKDLPTNSRLITNSTLLGGYYVVDGVKIWGYDLADPKKGFSVGQYTRFAKRIINNILSRGRLPIIVGGTGLYIRAITDTIPTSFIPQNKSLRGTLAGKTPQELYENLAQLDGTRAASLNTSDRANPRRLIRAIEIAQYTLDHPKVNKKRDSRKNFDILFIGLTANLTDLFKRIEKRVKQRASKGFTKEVKSLVANGLNLKSQAFTSLGYRQWSEYLEENISQDEALEAWSKAERAYIKRQLTWFKKVPRINWFDVSIPEWQKRVENAVLKWHNIAS